MTRVLLRSGFGILVVLLAVHRAEAAGDGCIPDWSVAAPIVKAEGLASVEEVTELARANVKGDVIKVTLCLQGSVYRYRLVVRPPDGPHKSMMIDAKKPFAR